MGESGAQHTFAIRLCLDIINLLTGILIFTVLVGFNPFFTKIRERTRLSYTKSTSLICGAKSKVKVLPIGKNLPQSIMEMFNRTETSLGKMHRRMEFQNLHFERTLKLLRKKRKNFLGKFHNFKSSQSRRIKRRNALKKVETKLKHKKATMQRKMKAKVSLESKRNQMLNFSGMSNLPMFTGAVVSPPPKNFRPRVISH